MMALVLQLTDTQGWEHVVTDETMQLGRHTGHYVTLCGATVEAASMAAPPGRPCSACRASPLR
jgi:hypothetical protein